MQQIILPSSLVKFHLQSQDFSVDPHLLAQIKYKGAINVAKVPIFYSPLKKSEEKKAKEVTQPNRNSLPISKIASKLPPFKKSKLEIATTKVCKRSKIRVSSN